ncbi:MAG: hypothetical protein ABR564_09155, partial [Candidatus Dormibacteria bacterium]
VAFMFASDTIGQADYDGLMEAIGREDLEAPTPSGIIAHIAGPTSRGGWQVIDVWESEEAANAFYGSEAFETVQAAAQRAGISITPWPLYRLEVYQTLRQKS